MGKYKINRDKASARDFKIPSKYLPKNPYDAVKNLVTNVKKFIVKSKVYRWINPYSYIGVRRLVHQVVLLAVTSLLVFSAVSPLFDLYITHKYYSFNSKTVSLVGNVGSNLAKQISYDYTSDAYVFNKDGMQAMTTTVGPDKVPLALLQAKVGGDKTKSKSLYAVTMPTDPKAGITYYDSNTGLSFSMVPNFTQMNAKQIDNHIVYPINKDMQMVYTVKNNGLKEDIVMKQYSKTSFNYSYSLKLPNTLEARLLTDGSGTLGIYSADTSLYNGSSDLGTDTAKIESAKIHASKTNLLFAIPAPVIKGQSIGNQPAANASFMLSTDGTTLTVSANNLNNLTYPASVDPSVVTTSTSDFSQGNNEDNNITYPANQINGGTLTGGSISGGWTAATVLPTATATHTTVEYNGYIYVLGGASSVSTSTSTVYYAAINTSTGALGSWNTATALPSTIVRATTVAYNGYIYEISGSNPSSPSSAVYYAAINTSTGALGTWTSTTALPAGLTNATSVAYNGYIYEIGSNTPSAVVDYAPINGDGTLGAWNATTSLLHATGNSASVVYNGYLYEIGGVQGSPTTEVDYAPINGDGTLGSWTATTALPAAQWGASAVVYNGYMYELGGSGSAVVDYAPINANGTVGSWSATTSLTGTDYYLGAIAYNGYIYQVGGILAGSYSTQVDYAKIDPAGKTTSYTATTALPAAISWNSSVAYNNYLYEIGGTTTVDVATVYYASINASTGTLGSWTSTTALPTVVDNASSVAYKGYIYVVNGVRNGGYTNFVYYSQINASTGALGSWSSGTSLPGSDNATSVAYNGYLYALAGNYTSVYFTTINDSTGALGSWGTTTSLPTTQIWGTSFAYNGYLYVIGGSNSTTVYYAIINSSTGAVGSWTTGTSMPNARTQGMYTLYDGYIYELGGSNSITTVDYAPINLSTGALGTWTSNTALPTSINRGAAVAYNGFLYLIGGGNYASSTAVYYAHINNESPGTAGSWTSTTALPTATASLTSVAYNGYVYEIGGSSGSVSAVVDYAAINASTGALGSWNTATSLPTGTTHATSVAYNGYIYEIGGYTTADTASVYYAAINASTGALGSWNTATSLPAVTEPATSVAYNGYLYEIGGANNAVATASVYYAAINASTGALGSWNTATSLPVATQNATSVAYNGNLYEIGGYSSAANTSVVDYASINPSTGALGSWTATTSLQVATENATSVAYNGYLYEIGGFTSTYSALVLLAPINTNGSIGSWTATTSLPTATIASASVVYNGYLYEIGGFTGSNTAVVDYAPFNVMPRIAHYSQVINFGSLLIPASITFNGQLNNAFGVSSISYKPAGANGVFGASSLSTSISGGSACAAPTVKYMSIDITLDDSQSASFPDVNYLSTNVTDFTVSMAGSSRPSQNVRLHGGKFFASEVLQPLDTCGP